ncbi:hypothetical protein [Acidovorax sp. SUPP2825]|uniref:hypothetical protein n=1 Tax=Acidovorax sp. SUPP2825 TaxID=2920879 RepID=UPI0023DE27B0|nr:hypothetical protein [Acidovorax sp. SUPP2825]GKS97437.1 hypothetical protein AVAK2825_22900 [Acidovorax sp. SUPP2825]
MTKPHRAATNELARLRRTARQFPVPLTLQARTQVTALLRRHEEAVIGTTLLAADQDDFFATAQNCSGFYIIGLSDHECAAAETVDPAGIEEAIRWAQAEPILS